MLKSLIVGMKPLEKVAPPGADPGSRPRARFGRNGAPMKKLMSLAAAALALLLLPQAPAAAQCDCANSSLMGTSVTTQAGGGPIVTSNPVNANIELVGAGPQLGMAGNAPRMNINYGVNTIRVDFTQLATYGTNYDFKFGNLNPKPPQGCSGTPKIVNIGVQTNKANAPYVVSSATFGPHSVNVRFGPPTGNIDWKPGEFILVTLKYACDAVPTGGGFDPCCPPFNSKQLQSMLFYQGTGSIASPYTLKFNPGTAGHQQIDAYVDYIKTLGMGFTSLSLQLQMFDAGTGNVPVPGVSVSGPHTATWTGTSNPSPNFFTNLMSVNRWYRIQSTVILNGGPGSSWLPEKCRRSYVDIRIQVLPSPFKVGPGRPAREASRLQMRLEDGTVLERDLSATQERDLSATQGRDLTVAEERRD